MVFWTRVRWLVLDAAEGCFGSAVPGYADWYTKRQLVHQTLIGTLSRHRGETPRQEAKGETKTPSGELPRARPRCQAANRRGRDRDDAEWQIDKGETKMLRARPRAGQLPFALTNGENAKSRSLPAKTWILDLTILKKWIDQAKSDPALRAFIASPQPLRLSKPWYGFLSILSLLYTLSSSPWFLFTLFPLFGVNVVRQNPRLDG